MKTMTMVLTMTMMTMMMVIGKRSNGQSGGQGTSDKGTEAYVLPPIQPTTSCGHCSAIFLVVLCFVFLCLLFVFLWTRSLSICIKLCVFFLNLFFFVISYVVFLNHLHWCIVFFFLNLFLYFCRDVSIGMQLPTPCDHN